MTEQSVDGYVTKEGGVYTEPNPIISTQEAKVLNEPTKKQIFMHTTPKPDEAKHYLEEYEKGNRKYNLIKIIELSIRGVEVQDILKIMDPDGSKELSQGTIQELIAKFKPNIDKIQIDVYRKFRTDIINDTERKVVEKLNTALDSGKFSLGEVAKAFNIVFDKRRLEENKSTANVASRHSSIVNLIEKRRQENS